MIKKIIDFDCLSGVSSPLLPLIYTDGLFSRNDCDGAFVQTDDNNSTKALFSMKNRSVIFISQDNCNYEEIKSFFEMLEVREITSDKPYKMLKNPKAYQLMTLGESSFEACNCVFLDASSTTEQYKAVFDLVCENNGSFENWFSEFSRKINSGNAKASYIVAENKAISVALAPAVYRNSAVIAGVFTEPRYRRKGYAEKCVKSLVSELIKNGITEISLWCTEENIPFYEKIGFIKKEKIYIGECI